MINHFIDTVLARLPAIAHTMPETRGQLSTLDAFLHDVRSEMRIRVRLRRTQPTIEN